MYSPSIQFDEGRIAESCFILLTSGSMLSVDQRTSEKKIKFNLSNDAFQVISHYIHIAAPDFLYSVPRSRHSNFFQSGLNSPN